MRQLSEEEKDRIRDERAIIIQDLHRPGVQLIFRKLDEAADAMLLKYDSQDFVNRPEKAVYIQCFRDIVKKEIPRIFENIINVDTPPEKPRWTFRRWLAINLEKLAAKLRA